MTGVGFIDRVWRMARSIQRSCSRLDADDLAQDALLHDLSVSGPEGLRLVCAWRTMRGTRRHESWLAVRLSDDDVDQFTDARTPEGDLAREQLRWLVRARLADHLARHPELRVAVRVLTGEIRARETANPKETYRATERLRERLRADEQMRAAWADCAA